MHRAHLPSHQHLRCLLGAMLLAGCAGTRQQTQSSATRPVAPLAAVRSTVDSMVRPASAEQADTTGKDRLPAPAESVPAAQVPALPNSGTEYLPTRLPQVAEEASASGSSAHPGEFPQGRPLTLTEAIDLAYRRQPRLRAYLEGVEQAQGRSEIAFAPFLPTGSLGYSAGGFNLNVGGVPSSSGLGFTVLPPAFVLPDGLRIQTGYELAEMRLQWLICDFGRRLGVYNAAKLGIVIHQLQTDRAYQTVAIEVAVAYYNVLRTQALLRTAREAVVRDEDQRDVAKKLERGGVIEREKLLRAEVQLAESLRLRDACEEAVAVAIAGLNLAIGLQPNEAVQVIEPGTLPDFPCSLSECLQTAVNERREFQVARRTVQVAQEGGRVAKADFAPRIVADGALFNLQQSSPRGDGDVALGFIKLDWAFFEGGKRIAEKRVADSKVREAMAQAESIADTIAFQVNESYRRMIAARLGIERARPAVVQAEENYRLVRARAATGDATPTEITDAETAWTRAQQNLLNSTYDYLSAIAKLSYAMGVRQPQATAVAPPPST